MAASTTQRIFLGHIKGEKGDQGDPATVEIGTVGTTAPGMPAEVTPSGTPTNLVLNFVLPRGEPGTGAGAAITALRSNACPSVYRCPIDYVAFKAQGETGGHQTILGAMDMLHWTPNAWMDSVRKTRVWYFTTHPTQGVLNAWERTAYSPYMEVFYNGYTGAPMFPPRPCPVNFATLGYRGNWCRSHIYYDEYFSAPKSSFFVAGNDFDGLVFTNTNRALWITGRGSHYTPSMQAIDLVGLANAAITSMWAGITFTDNWIWVIQQNRLMRCHIVNSSSATYQVQNSAVGRRINNVADMTFTEVTNASTGGLLPVTMNRVYAEGRYTAVWGTNPNNRISYFNGTSWAGVPLPAGRTFTATLHNTVIIFANGRLAFYDNTVGDYHTCDNPMAGASAVWTRRYQVEPAMMLTNGFQRGIPQFVPRAGSGANRPIYAEFDATTHEGGGCLRNPLGVTEQGISWPNEMYCSNRPDIVPLPSIQQGYLYSYGTRTSYTSMFGDGNTVMATAAYSPIVWTPPSWKSDLPLMPPSLQPPLPVGYLPTLAHRYGPVSVVDQRNRRAMMMYAADPGVVAG